MVEHDPTDLVGQEHKRTEHAKRAARDEQRQVEDFKWIMSNRRGRRFVWGLLEQAGVFKTSFTGNSETFFREGQRNMGLRVLALVNEHTPEMYAKMLIEQKDEAEK